MNIFIIARLSYQGKECGYRLYDRDNDKYVDWNFDRIITTLKHGGIELKNAELTEKEELKGNMGDLKKYPLLVLESDTVEGKNLYTILGKDSMENTYHVVDAYGIRRELNEKSIISNINRRGLSNATVVIKVKEPFIRLKGKIDELGLVYDYLEKEFNTPNYSGLVEKWLVRIIKTGDPYGRKGVLINEDKPKVEFISLDTNQFVARYYIKTLLEEKDEEQYGLDLNGEVDSWSITKENYAKILKWLRSLSL